jgi:hypothetical protein
MGIVLKIIAEMVQAIVHLKNLKKMGSLSCLCQPEEHPQVPVEMGITKYSSRITGFYSWEPN